MKTIKNVWNDQTGFTLLEAVFSMMILALMMSIIPFIFQTLKTVDGLIEVDQDYEWNLFLIGIRKEMEGAKKVHVVNVQSKTSLMMEKNNQVISYEPYGFTLRRRVNRLGHEIVLQNIQAINFSIDEEFMVIEIEFTNGVKDEARFLLLVNREES
ncbi:ComGF family competence protein [Lederbergia sp. NSJ-179]|uniref:competence type IV pilus minor pilin ComGF n=1 Tax=Lederbergia sp. NSJ-179 TaxID=2931402 RepID=UPI001FD300A9|nr:competence type IV pilus minor pilin ComGF [Lederbergia sp. NSJ-179]MCJ7839318.1 ComGF family competence protein [Lederbergia sp. NSJ-179]